MTYKVVFRSFSSLQAANRFLNSLYKHYDHARCIGWPQFSECGKYTFEVSNNPHSSLIPAVHTNVECSGTNIPVILSHN